MDTFDSAEEFCEEGLGVKIRISAFTDHCFSKAKGIEIGWYHHMFGLFMSVMMVVMTWP